MSYTINVNSVQAEIIIDKYQEYSLPHTNNYTLFRAKYKGATLTLYKTHTLLIQGGKAFVLYNEVCDLLQITPKLKEKKEKDFEPQINLSIIGTDEVGTGDFFGPIVVAGAYVDKTKILDVMKLGIRDSKTIKDDKIHKLANELIKLVDYHIVSLDNLKYNYLVSAGKYNMNKIKALLHNDVLVKLTRKVASFDNIIIDAFTSKDKYFDYIKEQKVKIENVELEQNAESKHLAVVCASILARSAFSKQLDQLSKKVGFDLPKGASHRVNLAIAKILKEQSEAVLKMCGKLNFKNLEKAKNNL